MSKIKRWIFLASLMAGLLAIGGLALIPRSGLHRAVPEAQLQQAMEGVRENRAWDPLARSIAGVRMVLVPRGCFSMGTPEEQLMEALRSCEAYYGVFGCKQDFSNEQPAHEVCLSQPFWIDRTAVTNWHYGLDLRKMGQLTGFWAPGYPRGSVTWEQADAHCRSRGGRLPTEAEWEFAARGPDSLIYPFGDTYAIEKATLRKISPAKVGQIPDGASWVGALDMSGGMSEWVADWYEPYSVDSQVDPQGPTQGEVRIARGGNWFAHAAYFVRTAFREVLQPDYASSTIGFRCVREFGGME